MSDASNGGRTLSIIVPTIQGREESLQRALDAYDQTLQGIDYEIVIVHDKPNWPTACNEGYRRADGDILHFTSDDLEPLDGWHQDALAMLASEDVLPAAAVYDYQPPPRGCFSNREDGKDGAFVHFTRVPILRRDQYQRIGEWPEIDYYADLWLSEKARTIGIRTRIMYSYAFVHHWHQHGRLDTQERLDESGWALNRLREAMT